jgi:hypothetical protein
MSRQRERAAVLRLLRGAGEERLSTRPADGEELESEQLKAKLGEMLLERELLEASGPVFPLT